MEGEEKREQDRRLAAFATKALGVVRVKDADVFRASDAGLKFLREEITRQAWDLAIAMEEEYQRRTKR